MNEKYEKTNSDGYLARLPSLSSTAVVSEQEEVEEDGKEKENGVDNLLFDNEITVNIHDMHSLPPIEITETASHVFEIEERKESAFGKRTRRILFKRKKKFIGLDNERDVSTLELFKYSDWLDRLLIAFGIIFAFILAALYPIQFLMYGSAAGTFVEIEKNRNLMLITAAVPLEAINLTTTTTSSISSSINDSFSIANDLCSSSFFTSFTQTENGDHISYIVRILLIIGCVAFSSNFLFYTFLEMAAHRQIKRIRNKLFESLIRQEIGFFDRNSPGELNNVLTGNLNMIQLAFGHKIGYFLSTLARFSGCLLLAMIEAWKFSIVFLAIAPFMIMSTLFTIYYIKIYTIEEFKSYGAAGKIAQEVLSLIRTILSLGMQKRSLADYERNLEEAEKMTQKKGIISGFFGGLTTGLFNLCFAIGIYYATYLARTDCQHYKAANLMLALLAVATSSFSFGQALPILKDITEARGAAKRVFSIIDKKSEIDVFKAKEGGGVGIKDVQLSGVIELKDVHFEYPTRKNMKILRGLNMSIPAGKTVALCGSSGGGKSTLIGLLQRFYKESSGSIKIDGRNIDDYDLEWLRSQMALVSQEPVLFSVSIKENIRLGRLDATDDEVIDAAKMANAHNFIMKCTQQYDTECGERGTQLSGGQKQRIAIARALLRNPKILLLDEATSALDYESEKMVQEALDRAKVGRTTIIIAHRLSTIKNADVIFGLSSGVMKEFGSHDDLMKLKGLYFELVTMQTREANKIEKLKSIAAEDDANVPLIQADENIITEYPDAVSPSAAADSKSSLTATNFKENNADDSLAKRLKRPFYLEWQLLKYHRPDAFWLIVGVIAQIVNGAVFPGQAMLFTEIYNIFREKDMVKQNLISLTYMGYLLGLAVASIVANVLCNYAFSICGSRLTKRLRAKMFESMLRQEIAFHDSEENRSSILSTKLAASVPFCQGLTVDKMSLLSQGFAGCGLAFVISMVINWKFCLVMLIFVPIMFASGVVKGRLSTNLKVNGKDTVEEGGRLTTEIIENIKTVVSLGREKHFLSIFRSIFNMKFRKTLAMLQLQGFFYGISHSLNYFIQATAFSFGFYLMINDTLTTTNLYRIYVAMTFSTMILGRVYAHMPDQSKARASAKTAFEIIERHSSIDSMDESGLRPDKVIGDIKFTDVQFAYPQRSGVKILRGLNFEVKNGTTNALVGPSGCGKSTTVALLLRFYDIESGSITLDGVDIRELNIQWLRSQIGLVSQEPVLFNYSIKQNVMFGDCDRDEIPMSEIMDACQQSNINSKIENLPDKYETMAGSRGGKLSGGEKQRIAIARALIRKPKILLLDEATSALDTQSEQIVQEALDNAQKGRTCMVIAHRLSTIQNSDKISVFKDGLLLEEGTHEELFNKKSFYYKLQSTL